MHGMPGLCYKISKHIILSLVGTIFATYFRDETHYTLVERFLDCPLREGHRLEL